MRRRYVTVDVFTDRAFGGNPLAVVLDAQGLSRVQMQSVAREFNYAETTFVLRPVEPGHTARVRIFTPMSEIPFAGHPNVGTAFVMAREGLAEGDRFVFEEDAGLVPVMLVKDRGVVTGAELTAPQGLRIGGDIAAADIAACAGLAVSDIREELHRPCVASVGLPFVVAELRDTAALGRAVPDVGAFRGALAGSAVGALFLHAADPSHHDVRHARMFAPLDGVLEDPATGSANLALAGLLASLRPEADSAFPLTVRQGETMGRPSLLHLVAEKRGGTIERITVRGGCVTMFRGTFDLTGNG